MRILAIETSCDETAAAVVEHGTRILSNVVASSTTMHQKYGGIVPEVAAREQLKCIIPTIIEATKNIPYDAIAVTVGPGLIGSLLVGVETAKTIAFATGKPIIPVNHVLAHMYANFVNHQQSNENNKLTIQYTNTPNFPAISLVVSGGHTELFLMESEKKLTWLGGTLDDAAGEAFDKTARLLGFENRGGPAIQEAANKCHMINAKCQIKLPRPMMHDKTLNFSFSGLKTAIVREWERYHLDVMPNSFRHPKKVLKQVQDDPKGWINALAFEVQEAITDVLVAKTINAAQIHNAQSILISGGVAANLRLREKFQSTIYDLGSKISFHVPPIRLCTDNAVYIGSYAFLRGKQTDWHNITAIPDLSVEHNL